MTIQTVSGGMWFPRPPAASTAPGFSTTALVIDASGEKAAFIVRGLKAGNIDAILWRTGTVTTGGTVDVRLETVDATTGDPTGTLWGTTTNGAEVIADGDDNVVKITSLTLDAAITADDVVAVVIVRDGVAGNMQIVGFPDDSIWYQPYADLFTAAWAKVANLSPVVGFRYDDGSYAFVPGCWPMSTLATISVDSGATPDVYGNRITLPFPCRVAGWWFWADMDGDVAIKLYDTDGVSVLASDVLDLNMRPATNAGIFTGMFTSAVDLSTSGTYRLGLEPSSATALTVYSFTVAAAAVMDAFEGGQLIYQTTAKDPTGTGSWTDTTTARMFMGLIVSGFGDDTGGAGGNRQPCNFRF